MVDLDRGLVAIFMLLLDITVVNVALPDIQRSLHSSFSDLQWVVNAYSLTLAAFLLTAGSVADLIGRKRVFVAGLVVFTAASAVCGLSSSPLMLNLARAVQGTGGAMMFATSLALLAEAFHGKERGTAFGVFGAVTGAAVAVGPVLGGVITSGIGWKWIFFVNVPIGAIAVFAHAHTGSRLARPERHRRRLGRPRHVLRVAVPARVRARAGQRKGLGLDRDRRLADRRRACCWSVFVLVEHLQSTPDARPVAVPPPRIRRREHRRVRDLRLVLRDVPVPHALHPGRARIQPAAGGPALPAGDAAVLRGRAGGRAS